MNMENLRDVLYTTKESSLTEFENLRCALEMTTKIKEITVVDNNDEVFDVIKGMKLTKNFRINVKNKYRKIEWVRVTKMRYQKYMDFITESKEDYPLICRNIKQINDIINTDVNLESIHNLVKLVYKTDKSLIKLFKEWNLIIED